MSDYGDLVGEATPRVRYPRNLSLPQKEHTPPRKNPRGSKRWVKYRRGLTYEERLKDLKLQSLD